MQAIPPPPIHHKEILNNFAYEYTIIGYYFSIRHIIYNITFYYIHNTLYIFHICLYKDNII